MKAEQQVVVIHETVYTLGYEETYDLSEHDILTEATAYLTTYFYSKYNRGVIQTSLN